MTKERLEAIKAQLDELKRVSVFIPNEGEEGYPRWSINLDGEKVIWHNGDPESSNEVRFVLKKLTSVGLLLAELYEAAMDS